MTNRTWIAVVTVAAALCAGATVANARATITGTRGQLSPTASNGTEAGRYRLVEISRSRATADRIETQARGLNVSGATRGNRPAFHVFLIKSDGSAAADFGAMRVNRQGNAAFVFDSRRVSFPSGVTTITDYSGGTIEVRDSSNSAVLADTLGTF
jgi:hypothetical protein